MAIIENNNIGIRAISACVPSRVVSNYDLGIDIPDDELNKIINSVGIKEKRYVDKDTCSSDLCYKAAEQLINDNRINKESIDALIFVSQTSDYHQPSTAPLLQSRLGLKTSTMAFDVNLACSGYVYGLSLAFALASQCGISNVLLLVGETMSKVISMRDKVAAPLFGDAGTATLVTSNPSFGKSFFSLNSDGSGSDIIKMPYGGYRNPSSIGGFNDYTDKDGNVRNGEQFFMNGMEVFNFGMKVEPRDIKTLLSYANESLDSIDLIIYHQANKLMTDFFTRYLKYDKNKTPYCLERYGNTSSASIPLTIVSELFSGDKYKKRDKVIMSGFGAGLSWGSVLLNLSNTSISKLCEY